MKILVHHHCCNDVECEICAQWLHGESFVRLGERIQVVDEEGCFFQYPWKECQEMTGCKSSIVTFSKGLPVITLHVMSALLVYIGSTRRRRGRRTRRMKRRRTRGSRRRR